MKKLKKNSTEEVKIEEEIENINEGTSVENSTLDKKDLAMIKIALSNYIRILRQNNGKVLNEVENTYNKDKTMEIYNKLFTSNKEVSMFSELLLKIKQFSSYKATGEFEGYTADLKVSDEDRDLLPNYIVSGTADYIENLLYDRDSYISKDSYEFDYKKDLGAGTMVLNGKGEIISNGRDKK